MPINYQPVPTIAFDPNPVMTGMKHGFGAYNDFMGALGKQLENQKMQQLMQFVTPMAQEQLKSAQQTNVWNPQIWQSQVRQLQNTNEQFDMLKPFLVPKAKAELAKIQEGLNKEILMRSIAQNYINQGGQGSATNSPQFNQASASVPNVSGQEIGGGGISGGAPITSQQGINMGAGMSQGQSPNLPGGTSAAGQYSLNGNQVYQNPAQNIVGEDIAQKYLGVSGTPNYQNINGTLYRISPLGSVTPVIQGPSSQQEAFLKGLGKVSADSYGSSVNEVKSLENQDLALDQMIKGIDNPEFYNTTGPVQSFLTNWAGTPARQQLLGSLSTASGEIVLQVAPSLKGTFSGKDQTLLNKIKASPDTDNPYVFIGKLRAQKLINDALKDRAQRAAEYKYHGMAPHVADKKAAEETPLSKYEATMDKLIHPRRNPLITKENIEATAKKRNISIDKVKKELKDRGYDVEAI